ncbi:hypothetical protein MSAN_01830900 [Mycena sanguinolenta]|uniref:Uncharacterized protein n=1 Tax=Mycena sanguinolenta TaxID=230812 RepID=A0A8H6XSQ5_9AGAR|nr:hypothetical protein MSAN_01830900 [Mycena sanguinolenta]
MASQRTVPKYTDQMRPLHNVDVCFISLATASGTRHTAPETTGVLPCSSRFQSLVIADADCRSNESLFALPNTPKNRNRRRKGRRSNKSSQKTATAANVHTDKPTGQHKRIGMNLDNDSERPAKRARSEARTDLASISATGGTGGAGGSGGIKGGNGGIGTGPVWNMNVFYFQR